MTNRRGFLGAIGLSFSSALIPASGMALWIEPNVTNAELSFSEIVANTRKANAPQLIENIKRNNALLHKFASLGSKTAFSGGLPVEHA